MKRLFLFIGMGLALTSTPAQTRPDTNAPPAKDLAPTATASVLTN